MFIRKIGKLLHTALLILILSFIGRNAFAQATEGARAAALAGTALTLEDAWSGFHNQAGLAYINSFTTGVFMENRFGMKELGDKGVTLALPFRNSAFGLNYRSLGYSAFNTSKAGLSYALKLSEKFSTGVQLNYHSIHIGENYGKKGTVSIEGGFLYKMSDKLLIGGHIFNPTKAKLADFNDERIPTELKLGLAYLLSEKVRINAEVHKAENTRASIRAAIEYWVIDALAIRGGFGSDPSSYSFGFGYRLSGFQIDAAAGFHQLLGFTPQLSLTYILDKN